VIPTQIESDVVIEAPISVVWRTITEPAYITECFSKLYDDHVGGWGAIVPRLADYAWRSHE